MQPSTAAAIWAAIAAWGSVVTAVLVYSIQRRNFLESVRPELIITGWRRELRPSQKPTVTFKTIRNIGRGAALNVHVRGQPGMDDTVIMSSEHLSILPPNEESEISPHVLIFWNKTRDLAGKYRMAYFAVEIHCWDSRGFRHQTIYRLMVSDPPMIVAGAQEVAPGVTILSRKTTTRAIWTLRVESELRQRASEWKRRFSSRPPSES